MNEIERKFLVTSNLFIQQATQVLHIKQGYLNRDPERTVRVRITNNKAYLTIKGITHSQGTTRFEWETEIPYSDALALLQLSQGNCIEKQRYIIPIKNHTFEVDVFEGDNQGIIIAEVELKSVNEPFDKPEWLGDEVTGKPEYYNANM